MSGEIFPVQTGDNLGWRNHLSALARIIWDGLCLLRRKTVGRVVRSASVWLSHCIPVWNCQLAQSNVTADQWPADGLSLNSELVVIRLYIVSVQHYYYQPSPHPVPLLLIATNIAPHHRHQCTAVSRGQWRNQALHSIGPPDFIAEKSMEIWRNFPALRRKMVRKCKICWISRVSRVL